MKTLDLDSIEKRAMETIRAVFDDVNLALAQSATAEGRGPAETLALVGVIRDLQKALAAVLPYAETWAGALDAAAQIAIMPGSLGRVAQAGTRSAADQAAAAVEEAKAELDSLAQKTRPLTRLEVVRNSSELGGSWTIKEQMRLHDGTSSDQADRTWGAWALEGTARAARRAALRGLPVPPTDIRATGGPAMPSNEEGQ